MASDPTFVAYAVELLSLLGPVQARPMFGGHGLYAEGVMFGLLDDGELFLKTDDETRAAFVNAGCRRWVYVSEKVRMEETSYFRPPDEAHEDREAMLPWGRLAVTAALRARASKMAKRARTSGAPSAKPRSSPASRPNVKRGRVGSSRVRRKRSRA